MALTSIFTKRGFLYGSFDQLLVITLLISTPVFFVLALLTTGFTDISRSGVLYAALGGVVASAVSRSFYFLGINYVGPGKALSINATSPLFAAILSYFVLDEAVTWFIAIGTVSIVVGVFGISHDVSSETQMNEYSKYVVLFPVLSALLAPFGITLRKLALNTGLPPLEAASINMVAALIVAIPIALIINGRDAIRVDSGGLKYFSLAGVVMTIGFVFYFYGLRRVNANVFFPLTQTSPIFATGLSFVFLQDEEILSRWSIASAVLITVGAILIVTG
jgi:drug/metabolite transporter (DMT)-like permease